MSTKINNETILRFTTNEGRTYEFRNPSKDDYAEADKFWELYRKFLKRNPTDSQKEAIRLKVEKIEIGFTGRVLPYISSSEIEDSIKKLKSLYYNTFSNKYKLVKYLLETENEPGLYVITTTSGFKVPVVKIDNSEAIVCIEGSTIVGYPVYNSSYQFGYYATYIGKKEEAVEIKLTKTLKEIENLSYEEIFEDASKVYDCTSFYKVKLPVFTRIYK